MSLDGTVGQSEVQQTRRRRRRSTQATPQQRQESSLVMNQPIVPCNPSDRNPNPLQQCGHIRASPGEQRLHDAAFAPTPRSQSEPTVSPGCLKNTSQHAHPCTRCTLPPGRGSGATRAEELSLLQWNVCVCPVQPVTPAHREVPPPPMLGLYKQPCV